MEEPKEESQLVNVIVSKPNKDVQVGGQTLVLELLEGWDELDPRQQKYLQLYAQDPTGNKHFPAMQLGYATSEVNRWFSQENFSLVASTIFDIFTDLLKNIDFRDALENSKIRGRVIMARENNNKYTKESKSEGAKHVHFHDFNLSDLLNS